MKDFDFLPSVVSVDVLAFIAKLIKYLQIDVDGTLYVRNVVLCKEEFELFKKFLYVDEGDK